MRFRKQGFTDAEVVHSNKSTTSTVGFFHALTGAMETAEIVSVRAGLDVSCCGLVSVKVAFQTSDDGVIWPVSTSTPPQFALAAATSEGTTYSTSFEDISASLTKKYVRFGVWVYNSSGSLVELCVAAIRIEPRKS